MPIETVKAEKSVDQLVTRVYGRLPDEQRVLARAALLRANPPIATALPLKRGTVIDVPTLPAQPDGPAATGLRASALSGNALVDGTVQALEEWRKRFAVAGKDAVAHLEAMGKLVEDEAVKKAFARSKDAPELFAAAGKALEARRSELAADQAFIAQELPKIDQALRALGKAMA